MPIFVSSSDLSPVIGVALPADERSAEPARFEPAYPAAILRTPPFTGVRRRADYS